MSATTKLVAFYIWTGPPGASEGLSRLPLHYAAGDIPVDEESLKQALDELQAAGYIEWDPANEVVLDCYALKYSPLRNGKNKAGDVTPDKRIPGAIRKIEELPASPLYDRFLALAKIYSPDLATALIKAFPRGMTAALALPEAPSKVRVETELGRGRQLGVGNGGTTSSRCRLCGEMAAQETVAGPLCDPCLDSEREWGVPYALELPDVGEARQGQQPPS